MIHCYMCDKDVGQFKTNSHIIPRCLFIPLKDDGQLALIDNVNKVNRTEQSELKGDFICIECEDGTKGDDAFAKEFFVDNDKKYALNSRQNKIVIMSDYNFIRIKLELYHNEQYFKFKKFILSLILRQYCYNKIKFKINLFRDHHLIKIRALYKIQKMNDEFKKMYPIVIWKYDKYESITYPKVSENDKLCAFDFNLLKYRVQIYINELHQNKEGFEPFKIDDTNFKCFVINGLTQWHKDLWNYISTNETKGKLKKYL